MAYYTLVDRTKGLKKWGIQFGDHDKEAVQFELENSKVSDKANGFKCDYKIVKTFTKRQSEIDAAVAALNAKG